MEIDLLAKYPKTKRNPAERAAAKTPEDRAVARQFGKEFFDGSRSQGYGGYNYNPRFWSEVVPDFQAHYNLKMGDKILDVGCAKGFMLYDFMRLIPGIRVRGVDISEYAIKNSVPEVRQYLSVGNAKDLKFYRDKEFDLVISINTVHNLPLEECKQAIREIERVGKRAFLTVDAWRGEEGKLLMEQWNLTAQTMMSTDDWECLFKEVGYTGNYYWFLP